MKKMTFTIDDRSARLLAELSERTCVARSRIIRWAIQDLYDKWSAPPTEDIKDENDS